MIDILKKYLIIEEWERELTDAIHNHQRITLHYKGFKGVPDPKTGKMRGRQSDFTIASPPGMRIVLPVALGLDKRTGVMVLRAYQTGGVQTPGRHGDEPEPWKYFRVDRISRVIPREGPNDLDNPIPPGYKRDDRLMSIHYAQIDDEVEGEKEPTPPYQEVQTQAAPQKNKLDKIPDNAKVVLKPEEPAAPPPTEKPKPAAPVPPAQPARPAEKPELTEPVQPAPEEPEIEEPEDTTREIKEWINRLNKIL